MTAIGWTPLADTGHLHSVIRVTWLARRGVTWCSWYSAGGLRRNRFSAARAGLGRRQRHRKRETPRRWVNSVQARSITGWITLDRRSIAVALLDVVSAHLRLLSWRSAPTSRAMLDAYLLRVQRRPHPLIRLKNAGILFLRITGG